MGGRGSAGARGGGSGGIDEKLASMKDLDSDRKENLIPLASESAIQESNRLFQAARRDKTLTYTDTEVPISKLKTRQEWVDTEKLRDIYNANRGTISGLKTDYDGGVRALSYKGDLIVVDGNHRTNAAILRNQKKIKIRVAKLD